MRGPARLIVRILGLVLIAGALALIGHALWNLRDASLGTAESLEEAEALVSGLDEPLPDESLPPATDGTTESPGATETATPDNTAGDAPKAGSVMGVLILDSLGGRKVPLVEGATARDLARGAGHHPRSSQPGQVGNCVVYGHRNTVFRGFADLSVGDTVRIQLPDVTYTYAIESMKAIDPDNKIIFAPHDYAALTLVTCYPFNYVGPAPRRYLVVCRLVD